MVTLLAILLLYIASHLFVYVTKNTIILLYVPYCPSEHINRDLFLYHVLAFSGQWSLLGRGTVVAFLTSLLGLIDKIQYTN